MIPAFLHRVAMVFLAVLPCVAWAAGTALPDFTALVEHQGVAVVNVSAIPIRDASKAPSLPDLGENGRMFDFFRRFAPQHPEVPQPQEPDDRSLGSGFIISPDGYILTNAHVVDEAEEILVRLADKREFRARVIGADPRSDVALLKIEADTLPQVVLGDAAKLKVGEWVIAIGSPFGFEQTVTAGIVSAKGRSLPNENFVPFIQTDVAINPGNSGGPLFNLKGEVVGINSQIYSRTGGFMGLSFAIPIDVAMNVQQQLRTTGRVQRGRIGVAIQEVTRDLADSFGLARAAGALVSTVEADSPAARAGVEQGDVIVRFDGKAVENSNDLPRIVAATQPGTKARAELIHNGTPRNLMIEVGEWQQPENPRKPPTSVQIAPNLLGLTLTLPTQAQRRERSIDRGLMVERVQGAAARTEIRQGDVILALVMSGKQWPLKTVTEFNRLATELKAEQQVTLLTQRGAVTSYISLRADKQGTAP